MKRLSVLLVLFALVSSSCMADTIITYEYDDAGNRTTRTTTSSAVASVIQESMIRL